MEDYSFKREYTLKAHSPLIHFQYDNSGATLRATEVKPKLDRYIIYKKGRDNIPESWKRDNNDKKDKTDSDNKSEKAKNFSLKYQLRIVILEGTKVEKVYLGIKDENGNKLPKEEQIYDIYYGNMGADASQYKKGILADAKLIVTCFEEDLLAYIDKIIGDFFIVTNFGTMQSKGFGSFTVKEKDSSQQHICEVLKAEYTNNKGHCYMFKPEAGKTFKQIKAIYSLMKSGLNFTDGTEKGTEKDADRNPKVPYKRSILFDYMHDLPNNIGNEKAWMKQKDISPKIGRQKEQKDKNSKYVRALFGIGERIEYKRYLTNPYDKVVVTISHVDDSKDGSEKIERLNSPILFKVIDDIVYFVGCELNEKIYGKRFLFSSEFKHDDTLTVPKKEDLPSDFMNDFMHYAYQKLTVCKNKPKFGIKDIDIKEV